jgi:cytochrome c1
VSHDLETKFEIAPRFEELTRKSEEQLRARLMMRHVMMPQFPKLTLQNVADISAYMKSLKGQ